MLEPDSTRAPEHPTARPLGFGANALQILMTEHWSLLASRSLVYTEAMSRTSIYVAALTGTVVALALVAQADQFGDGFVAFALVLLPVVYFLGFVTIVRLAQVNQENARWVQGMNRIRNAYLQLEPELQPYFVTSKYDDDAGVLESAVPGITPTPHLQAFVAAPGVVAVLDSVVAGATAGIACIGVDLGLAASITVGAACFLGSLAFFAAWARRRIGGFLSGMEPLFPSPPDDRGT